MNSVGWCLCWLVGCGVGLVVVGRNSEGIEPPYGQAVLLLAATCLIPLLLSWPDKRARWVCLLTLATLGGCGTALLIHPPVTPDDLAYYNSLYNPSTSAQVSATPVLVIGKIASEPVFTDRSQRFKFSSEQIRHADNIIPRAVKGDLYTVVPRYPEREYGARLSLSGTLTSPPSLTQFDYPAYLARQGVFSYMSFPRITELGSEDSSFFSIFLRRSRPAVREALQKGIPEPQAALAVGVVTGDRSQIPDDVKESFLRSGIQHIIAISGQNIAILTGVVWLFYGARAGRRMTIWAFGASCALIILYTLFTGANPAVVRAAIMGVVLLFAPIVRRRYDPIAALAVTATIMLALDPDVLADPGFQLSCAAMLGIASFAQPLYRFARRLRLPSLLALTVAVSIAAQATTLPLVSLLFGRISTVALPATVIAEVALLPLMITGIVAGLFGAIFAPFAVPFGLLAWPFAAWIVWWGEFWGSLPWASLDSSAANPAWVVVYYSALAAVGWLVNKVKKNPLTRGEIATALLCVTGIALWAVFIALVVA